MRQIEKIREYNTGTCYLFVDFKSAYDSVIKTKLYQAIGEFQIPPKIIRMVKAIMTKVICKVRIQDEISESFETTKGVRQLMAYAEDIVIAARSIDDLRQNFIKMEETARCVRSRDQRRKDKNPYLSNIENEND